MPKSLRLNYKEICISFVISLLVLIISQYIPLIYNNHTMFLIPFMYVGIVRSKNSTNDIVSLLVISCLYLILNPVNILLQITLMLGVIGLYFYFLHREIRESQIGNLVNIFIYISLFVVVYYVISVIINNQNFNFSLSLLAQVLGNIFINVLLVYCGLWWYKHQK